MNNLYRIWQIVVFKFPELIMAFVMGLLCVSNPLAIFLLLCYLALLTYNTYLAITPIDAPVDALEQDAFSSCPVCHNREITLIVKSTLTPNSERITYSATCENCHYHKDNASSLKELEKLWLDSNAKTLHSLRYKTFV